MNETVLVALGGVASVIAIGGVLFGLSRWLLSRMRASSMVTQLERRSTSPPILGRFAKDFEKTEDIESVSFGSDVIQPPATRAPIFLAR